MPKKNKKKKAVKTLRKLIDIGIFLLIVLLITLVLNRYVIQRTKVHNVSMQGTLKEGDVLLTDMISYAFDEPKRFDIICFRNPGGGDDLIKRIIALPGESIRIAGGEIYIDGEKIDDYPGLEPADEPGLASSPIVLETDEYFVLGDNRDESIDSRFAEVGNVRRKNIIGRAFIRIYPFNKIKKL